jgi:hypothetical protein
MLLQLRDYIQREGGGSLQHLARVFQTDVTVLEVMLQQLIQRKMITPDVIASCHKKSCQGCGR